MCVCLSLCLYICLCLSLCLYICLCLSLCLYVCPRLSLFLCLRALPTPWLLRPSVTPPPHLCNPYFFYYSALLPFICNLLTFPKVFVSSISLCYSFSLSLSHHLPLVYILSWSIFPFFSCPIGNLRARSHSFRNWYILLCSQWLSNQCTRLVSK